MTSSFVIAIQCRTGSTRLPGKMTRPFFQGRTILQVMLEELLSVFDASDIVIATSTNAGDSEIAEIANEAEIECARGSEDDVLDRVWQAVRSRDVRRVARVCADNPFLRAALLQDLLQREEEYDYASFETADGTPTILSHLGLFAEVVAHETLQKMHKEATSARHREHLTSHILDNPATYRRTMLKVPTVVSELEGLRLTVDTEADFVTSQSLYEQVHAKFGWRFTVEELMGVVRIRPELLESMATEISANAKG